VASIRSKAQGRAENLRAIVDDMRAQGIVSIRQIAEALNTRGILTPRGGHWHATSAARVLGRLDALTLQGS
jgi:Recombinase